MADYMGLRLKHMDSTEMGGSSYIAPRRPRGRAIAAGKCKVALITPGRTAGGQPRGLGEPRREGPPAAVPPRRPPARNAGRRHQRGAEAGYENIWGGSTHNTYGMCAMRHHVRIRTTSEQLAWIKVAASHHAQWNEHAYLPRW